MVTHCQLGYTFIKWPRVILLMFKRWLSSN